jgi:hypothetical protein
MTDERLLDPAPRAVGPRPDPDTDKDAALYVRSYLWMRVGVGVLGIALPPVLVFGATGLADRRMGLCVGVRRVLVGQGCRARRALRQELNPIAKTLDERRDLISVSVWCVGKLVDRIPRRSRRHARIARKQVLMEVVALHADHRNVDAFRAFVAQCLCQYP